MALGWIQPSRAQGQGLKFIPWANKVFLEMIFRMNFESDGLIQLEVGRPSALFKSQK